MRVAHSEVCRLSRVSRVQGIVSGKTRRFAACYISINEIHLVVLQYLKTPAHKIKTAWIHTTSSIYSIYVFLYFGLNGHTGLGTVSGN